MPVDGARNDLFPGSGFTGDEHRGVTIGDESDRLLDRAHRGARTRRRSRSVRGEGLIARGNSVAAAGDRGRRAPQLFGGGLAIE